MMTKYFIADTHFGHEDIIGFDGRPFATLKEMHREMKNNWNTRVAENDDVYIVGDFWFQGTSKYDHDAYDHDVAIDFIRGLNGYKYLVIGNHDRKPLTYPEFKYEFVEVADIMKIDIDDQEVILCHYPMLEWENSWNNAWHIHGHIHNKKTDVFCYLRNKERALNAGAAIVQYMPVTFDELIDYNNAFKQGK